MENLEVNNREWQQQQIIQNRQQKIPGKVKIFCKPRRIEGSGQTLMFLCEQDRHIIVKF